MKYFDSGSRQPSQTLAHWLVEVVKEDISEIRIQTGFFSISAIELLRKKIEHSVRNSLPINIVLGSNEKNTLKSDIEELAQILDVPNSKAKLGIVSFSNGFFHPKTFHFVRADGSQTAFVGSANFTSSGLALHVEAAISLDTRDGDDIAVLSQISSAIDIWFIEERLGLTQIINTDQIDFLTETGVLALTRPERTIAKTGATNSTSGINQPTLKQIFTLPKPNKIIITPPTLTPVIVAPQAPASVGTTVQRSGFPHYILFAQNASGPTKGLSALTSTLLSNNHSGIIVKLNKDSGRHFVAGSSGTANISVPVEVATTLRFGIYGTHNRPRAEFPLEIRYINQNTTIVGGVSTTSVMGYGFTKAESGHGDIRMVVTSEAKKLAKLIRAKSYNLPKDGDLAILEWPTPNDPCLRLTFVDSNSTLKNSLASIYGIAEKSQNIVGKGACWLPAGVSPIW